MDLKKRLEFLDTLVWLEAQTALSCFALKWYMALFFYNHDEIEKETLFKTNIANTFLYRANLSHFERSLVNVADQIHEELNREPKPNIEIMHRWDLKNHRDYLSHPGKAGQFDNKDMKKFIEEKRFYKEPQVILIWNARRSIVEKLIELGSDRPTKHPMSIYLSTGMPELVHGAIDHCLNDGIQRPTILELKMQLQKFFEDFHTHLEKEAESQFQNSQK